MLTEEFRTQWLTRSVIAVPPLPRDARGSISGAQNRRVIDHIRRGGVTTLLYGGNAVLYHIRPSEYAGLIGGLAEATDEATWVIPSAGPSYGMMMDQAVMLRELEFPTAMVLPQQDVCDDAGTRRGISNFAERFGQPIVLYIKFDNYLPVEDVAGMVEEGVVAAIKYAIVREDPLDDEYLRELVDVVPSDRIVSGIGEQPAIAHLREYRLAGFTTGCGCVAPRLSQLMLEACRREDWEAAERLRALFEPLEELRNRIHPIRVLHQAVELAAIAETGMITPLMSPVAEADAGHIAEAARSLRMEDERIASPAAS